MAKVPCYGCTERVPHCHGKCEKYNEYKKSLECEKQVKQDYNREHIFNAVITSTAYKKSHEKQLKRGK